MLLLFLSLQIHTHTQITLKMKLLHFLNNCLDSKSFTRVLIHHSAARPARVLIVHLMKYVSHKCNKFTVRFISCFLNETFHCLFRLLASQLGNLCMEETTFRFDQEEMSYAIRIPVREFYAEV